ncbi:MAG: phosphatidate cytidylyltransferase [Firmicutes bacterium]|nr:phosphatidate cytidylyltransferase [Bacillota bacterium]
MKQRTITALGILVVYAVLIGLSIYVPQKWGGRYFYDALVLTMMVLAGIEMSKVVADKFGKPILPLVLINIAFGYALFVIVNNTDFLAGVTDKGGVTAFFGQTFLLFLICVVYNIVPKRKKKKRQSPDAKNEPVVAVLDAQAAVTAESGVRESSHDPIKESVQECGGETVQPVQDGMQESLETQKVVSAQEEIAALQKASLGQEADEKKPDVVDIRNIFTTLFVVIYPVSMMVYLLAIGYLDELRVTAILLTFLVSSFTDTFAYLVGRTLKGRKLAPVLSPKKTVSGALGGLFGGVVAAMVVYGFAKFGWLHTRLFEGTTTTNIAYFLTIGVAGSVLNQFGDIMASYIKRVCGKKDYGTFMPGHGGVLDRIDGMMIVAIFVYAFCFGVANVVVPTLGG